ncbi:hypothetical protein RUND412_006366 [Rhizina undulata]
MDQGEQHKPQQDFREGSAGTASPPTEKNDERSASNTAVQNDRVNNSASSPEAESSRYSAPAPGTATAAAGSAPTQAKASRKRTKTGCLTCRKRRIKCGEERPTCANCIKSKRLCEGYNQRVIFKYGAHGLYHRSGVMSGLVGAGGASGERRFSLQPAPGPQTLQPIAPAPPPPRPQQIYVRREEPITPLDESRPAFLTRAIEEQQQQRARFERQQRAMMELGAGNQHQFQPGVSHQQEELYHQHHHHQEPQLPAAHQDNRHNMQQFQYYPQPPASATGGYQISPTDNNHMHPLNTPASGPNSASLYGSNMFMPQYNVPSTGASFSSAHTATAADGTTCAFNPPLDPKYTIISGGEHFLQQQQEFAGMYKTGDSIIPDSVGSSSRLPIHGANFGDYYQPVSEFGQNQEEQFQPRQQHYDDIEGHGNNGSAMENNDEEFYDYEDEDEDDEDYEELNFQHDEMLIDPLGQELTSRAQISNILEPHSRHLNELSRISFRSFLPDAGILTSYYPSMTSSPLMNPTTAKIFCHFVYVLGPSMSLFERHAPNPHMAFTPGAGLHGPQNVWSYTLPMLSLSHPPLLHAILAISSLHISKLTKGPAHASHLHYHIALRRLGKAISNDKHRGHIATLAATLMLAYYETMAADHDKWCSHIHGAKQLLKEIDFYRVAQRVELDEEEERMAAQSAEGMMGQEEGIPGLNQPSLLMQRKIRRQIANDVDESLTAYMMGGRTYRRRITGLEGQKGKKKDKPFTKQELDKVELQADMFWWFAKMDTYQSILGGCPLVLDYILWGQCPPRARIGTLGTTYGSSDHFFLLLGRLADFQVRDLKRKKAVQRANGGVWIPPPEMGGPPRGAVGRGRGMGGPPGAVGGPNMGMGRGIPPGGFPQGPMQYGMIPTSDEPPRLPTAFANLSREHSDFDPSPQPSNPLEDLEAATVEAEMEWKEIFKAFQVFQESLGHEYQPLPIEYMPVHQTPFGDALYYRTFSIASLQMLYNMALVILHRCHPSMPAVAMMAASVAARKTAMLAVDIARMTAGLVPTDPTAQINPALGSSLVESSVPMFFAAVQYQDPAQQDWVVKKLREITRLTGWSTASRILLGCQRAWETAATMGKGPKYERPPFEEEGEFYREPHDMKKAKEVEGGAGGSRFVWHISGLRAADASGILGDPWEDLGMSNLSM